MKEIELLAPAGSLESMQAAVLNGADAVYLGGSKFSARAYASNFDEKALKDAVDYCHIYGVKVYITLNTLIKQYEIDEAFEYINYLYIIGVDAIIIQDLGIAYLVKKYFPDFELHASTQMTVHNGEGAVLLKEQGFDRIVLSRELSVEEIRHISLDYGIETEIFVHGALCICYSGQCLMSSIIGGRSGNRGRCAQPCRLPYRLIDKSSGQGREGYLLSPKDMCTLDNLKDIAASGTVSLKIEGRMKRPEYVAGVVGIYRKVIDVLSTDKSVDTDEELRKLMILFNREGFSKAYLYGNTGRDMMALNNPKNAGILLGKAGGDKNILLKESIAVGDGVRVEDEGFTVTKIEAGSKEVEASGTGSKVKIYPQNYKAGDVLYKTSDAGFLRELAETYRSPYMKKLTIDLEVIFIPGEAIEIKSHYKGRKYISKGDIVQQAVNKPIDRERLKDNLRKTGDTPFEINNVDFSSFKEGFLPVSAINSCRRSLLDEIMEAEKSRYRRETSQVRLNGKGRESIKKQATVREHLICVSDAGQLRAARECGFGLIAVDAFKRGVSIGHISEGSYLKVPNIIKSEFEEICSFIEERLGKIKGIVTGNFGIINRFKNRTDIIGDYKLNIFNGYGAVFLSGLTDKVSISAELNKKEINDMIKSLSSVSEDKRIPDLQMMVYGKMELMVSEYCPIGACFGNTSAREKCSGACSKGQFVLRDRKDAEFLLKNDRYCRSYIYNNVPLNLLSHIPELEQMNISSFRLDFIDESYEETKEILSSLEKGEVRDIGKNYTKGHYKRGVE